METTNNLLGLAVTILGFVLPLVACLLLSACLSKYHPNVHWTIRYILPMLLTSVAMLLLSFLAAYLTGMVTVVMADWGLSGILGIFAFPLILMVASCTVAWIISYPLLSFLNRR